MKSIKFYRLITISLLTLIGLFITCPTNAQIAVTSDGTPPDESAMLDIKSTDKGLLLPRMTQSEIEAITNPANGLIVYNIDVNNFYYFNQGEGKWIAFSISNITITPGGITCGETLYDGRDGQSYATVQIGSQCWMAENLNYEVPYYSWVYDDDPANAVIYGRLYTLGAALTACPAGWHLPTISEWQALTSYLMEEYDYDYYQLGDLLKETGNEHWIGYTNYETNASGFTAIPGGIRSAFPTDYSDKGTSAYFWSATAPENNRYYKLRYDSRELVHLSFAFLGEYGLSVRCIKD